MKTKLLSIIEKNPLLSADELAVMLDTTVETVKSILEQCKSEGIILGTKTIINWDKAGKESVSAFIELKTVPQRDKGFDAVAERVANHEEVKSVFLMSHTISPCWWNAAPCVTLPCSWQNSLPLLTELPQQPPIL